ncbi:MAG: hypothetical protein NXH90_13240 [Flavobacteriaceae bacterium]|nr:hypothetical protein [Flavobacteriaceae bacterium]
MDKGYEKEGFAGMRIKMSVAKKFRRFSKSFGKSQSLTLLAMIDFFEVNGVSPKDRLGATISSLKHQMKQRFNAVIAIIRDIEKNQTKPTNAMLELLFQESSEDTEPLEEFFEFGQQELITENEELDYYRSRYEEMQQEYHAKKNDLERVIDKTIYVKGSFGGGYLKLDLSKEEFENLKQKTKNVRNNNQAEHGG